jgi:hypothetical protein
MRELYENTLAVFWDSSPRDSGRDGFVRAARTVFDRVGWL